MRTTTLLSLVLLAAPAPAQEERRPREPERKAEVGAKVLALVGGEIRTVSRGVIRGGTVLIRDGKIAGVGPALEVPKDAEVIDASGRVITPGFVAMDSSGIAVQGGGAPGRFGGGGGGGEQGKVADTLDPYDFSVTLALASGLTTIHVPAAGGGAPGGFGRGRGRAPQGGRPVVGDPGAAVKLARGDLGAMLLKEPAILPLHLAGAAPSDLFALRENLRKAKEAAKRGTRPERREPEAGERPEAPAGGRRRMPPQMRDMLAGLGRASEADADKLLPAVKGEIAVRADVELVQDIRTALQLAEEFGLRLVLRGATEGWAVAPEIARIGGQAVVTPRARRRPDETLTRESGSVVRYGSTIENAAILSASGVRIAILPGSAAVSTNGIAGRDLMMLPMEAAFGIRGGLDEEAALRAITLAPAEMLGVADRVGSIEEGKDADLLILDGDPFDYRTWVEKAFVNGKLVYDKGAETLFSHIRAPR